MAAAVAVLALVGAGVTWLLAAADGSTSIVYLHDSDVSPDQPAAFVAVARPAVPADLRARAQQAIVALGAGPTAEESAAGLSSAIPSAELLRSVTLDEGGRLVVDYERSFEPSFNVISSSHAGTVFVQQLGRTVFALDGIVDLAEVLAHVGELRVELTPGLVQVVCHDRCLLRVRGATPVPCVPNASRYARRVLRSFRDEDTERVWQRQRLRRFDEQTQRAALRKLLILDAADALSDLRVPPGNRLEKLRADRANTYSIRINRQWRICFRWTTAGPEDVEIVDYH